MIEVFRTNVTKPIQARILKEKIHKMYNCEASFDLDDCDRILRVKSKAAEPKPEYIIKLLQDNGFFAEVLPENYPRPIIQSILNARLCW